MRKNTIASLTLCSALVAGTAAADPVEPPEPIMPADPAPQPSYTNLDLDDAEPSHDDSPTTRYGMSISAGAGVSGFTDPGMRGTTEVGNTWDLRAAFGTHSPIGFEAGYIGSVQTIESIGLDDDAELFGTAIEGLARVNLLPDATLDPYFFGGVAWRRYDLTNVDTNHSDVTESDNLMEVPVGVGLGYRLSTLVVDVRGEMRVATGEDLVRPEAGNEDMKLHTWSASARLGYEF